MKIRSEQWELLAEQSVERFRGEAGRFVVRHWPEVAAGLDAEGLGGLVDRAVQGAGQLGLEREGEILRYLQLMCTLGAGFPTDSTLPWVAETLKLDVSPAERLDELQRRAEAHLGSA